MQANSYQEAILLLERLSIVTDDQTAKLKAVITQNLIVYALWVLYCGDKRINELKGKEELTDSKIDNWIEYIVSNFSILVTQEVKLLLYHRRELALTSKKMKSDSKKLIASYTEREKMIARLSFVPIVLDKLSASQIDLYKEIWYDLVEITNAALVVRPFRREPP